jgi:tRNA A37 threonylcarbamoyladenosine biosynthesis protein TsaE
LIIAVVSNIAAAQLPDRVKPHLWWAWPVLFLLAIVFVIVTIVSSKNDKADVTSPEFNLKRYYDALRNRYQFLDLDALTPPQKEEYLQIQLRSVFVEQNVRENPPPMELPKEILEKLQRQGDIHLEDLPEGITEEEIRATGKKYFESSPTPVLDVLTSLKNRQVVVLGDPGSGKSTLTPALFRYSQDPAIIAQNYYRGRG